ncbi:alkaline phosphatase D family protein [Pseudomonadota bacterium]
MGVSRRRAIQLMSAAGWVVATSSPVALLGCIQPQAPGIKNGSRPYSFTSGVASADPQPNAIVLWTRAVKRERDVETVNLIVQLARDELFDDIILENPAPAASARDFTVRVFVDGLTPDTVYHYRFIAPDGTSSPVGRTWTAPSPDQDRDLRIAVVSCQLYMNGFFNAYRRLVNDASANGPRPVDLIAHVGDFVYEYENWENIDRDGKPLEIVDTDGSKRALNPFSNGVYLASGTKVASSLSDYRSLYRDYIGDRDLQEARRLFPWVHIWDDHEVYNDVWQSYFENEASPTRRTNATQAWFEYIPCALTHAAVGPAGLNPARDYKQPVGLRDALATEFDDDYLSHEPNNLSAINSIRIYRSLSWGKRADITAIDGRSYRGPRGVPQEVLTAGAVPYPSDPIPPDFVETMNAGRTANKGDPPKTVVYQGVEVENPRVNSPVGGVLGAEQKAWLKASLKNSRAKWKVVLNNTPFMRFGFDNSFQDWGVDNGLFWTDSWDGYPVERRELMSFIRDENIANVVSLTGDRHCQAAGLVYNDYDGEAPSAVIPEFACTAISSPARIITQYRVVKDNPKTKYLVAMEGTKLDYETALAPSLNAWIMMGAEAAFKLAETGNETLARERDNPAVNRHLEYVDTDANGYLIATFGENTVTAEFVTVPEPKVPTGDKGPELRRSVKYRADAWEGGEEPNIQLTGIVGPAPLLGIR